MQALSTHGSLLRRNGNEGRFNREGDQQQYHLVLGWQSMASLFLGENGPQVVPQHPVIYHHPRFAILDNDEQQNDVVVISRPRMEKSNLVYHALYTTNAERYDWIQGFVAGVCLV
jgi:hypothetical protein